VDNDVLLWRVEQLEAKQRELERNLMTALEGVRLAQQADYEKIQRKLDQDYLSGAEVKLAYVSKKDERYQTERRYQVGLYIVGLLAGVSSLFAILEQIRQIFG